MTLRHIGDIGIRTNHLLRPGDVCGNHKHNFGHVSRINAGRVRCVIRDEAGKILSDGEYGPGDYIFIAAELFHEFTALVGDTQFDCIYSHRNAEGEVIPEYSGNDNAYR